MQGLDILLWAVRAFSFFNTVCFLWLGLAVLLNAQRRVLGTWIVGGGLVLAGLFFVLHTTVVGREVAGLQSEISRWWWGVWFLFVCPAWAWYAVICWYSGALSKTLPRAGLVAASVAGTLALALVVGSDVLPSFQQVRGAGAVGGYARGEVLEYASPWGTAVSLLYPIYGAG